MEKYIDCKIVHLLLLPQLRSKRAIILILDFPSSWILRSGNSLTLFRENQSSWFKSYGP